MMTRTTVYSAMSMAAGLFMGAILTRGAWKIGMAFVALGCGLALVGMISRRATMFERLCCMLLVGCGVGLVLVT